jgi:hypothetical protein
MPGSHLKFVRTLDFGVLDGLAARAAAEIRETEDALIAFIEAEQKRGALHLKTKREIAAKYNQQDRLGGAAWPTSRWTIDYLIRQQQQERIRQRFDALFTKDDDHAAAATQGIENLAYHTAQEAAAAYDYLQESLTDVITQTRHLPARIESGIVPEKDVRKLLADLHKQHAEPVAKIAPTKSKYDSAQATLKDPAARREALINKYPALRR